MMIDCKKLGWLFVLFTCLLAPVVARAEYDPQKAFDKAMKDREEGRYEQAIKGFQTILSNNPQLGRARLELAVAYFYALNFNKAIAEAEKVLNDPTTPEAVKVKIKRFLAQVRNTGKKHNFEALGSIGYMYDSNVNVGPDNIVLINGAPISQNNVKAGDHATLVHVGASHRYTSGRNVQFGKVSAAFLWLSQVDLYWTDYQTMNGFDLAVLSLNTGPSYIAAKRWRAGIGLRADVVRLGYEDYALFTGVNPNITWMWNNQKTELTVDVMLQNRNYKRSIDQVRDSLFQSVGVSLGHLFEGDKLSLQGGLRLFNENADGAGFDNKGHELFIGASYRASTRTRIYGRVSRRNADYSGIQPGLSVERREDLYRYVLGLDHKWTQGFMRGWTLRASITRTENKANVAVYDYDRTQTALALERSFK